ncbi:putative virion structural protein [Klebsiella phage N1M2]|uniref:Putative virion structural protein n=1 Tax=Klebsiella phage N1M2 TaxID=2664939 RepID=A0A6B7ZF56_9CAUD|nr:putative virion structural protein [Klebsiella phage N1M2]QGH71949.1 putative virion structural protein [Klebsiella phage N1M2]
MTQVLPKPNAPKESTDYIYGKRLAKYEDRMNFFLNEKVDIDKTNVKDIDAGTVDGLENLVQRFTSYGKPSFIEVDDSGMVAGTEASGKAKRFIDIIIQAAKDAVEFILNFINNRIARLDVRSHRAGLERKRSGIKDGEARYPASIRRLMLPQITGGDPNWVPQSLDKVLDIYKNSVKGYKYLTSRIDKWEGANAYDVIKESVKGFSDIMGMSYKNGGYQTDTLPGVRQLIVSAPSQEDPTKIDVFFNTVDVAVKLPTPTFHPTSNLLDSTLNKVNSIIKEIRSNQSTMSQLSRNFEKAVRKFEANKGEKIGPEERKYYEWLIRFNKRMMNTVIQYTISELDAGIDFVNAGIDK